MSEYNDGDLVEAVKGEQLVRGRIFIPTGAERQFLGECGERVVYYEKNGFTITVIEKAKPKVELPTESGYYAGFDEVADTEILVMVSTAGRIYLPNASKHLGVGDLLGDPERFAPYVKLEPRAVTVKAVLNAVTATLWPYGPTTFEGRDSLIEVAKEFGAVTP